ncbi:hypothetical protein GUITHDRAFT_116222 [Guillardia theta CCMP2712]|uniref:Uncharacterized protein n=1 Tax=Guillardia theta (strain CCMP2712) TaxID=905079 RepID=L1IMT7_GUITC|nr:hypothetical protein GUITHDRAFT_116222 [Guillardia theta CCMP2712]EKX37581.1 hypothetical protein GUITHDRAFT_116222 [Guillardia theta CCMP2712]|eukprot:XP_005824561.1 hypothetical protein GUITHDRAFT_116222 [Guillardia theta CCMP2712]
MSSMMSLRRQMFEDHPWDLANPEGMPTMDGKLISAAQMFDEAGSPPVLSKKAISQGSKPASHHAKRDESHSAEINAVLASVFQQQSNVRPMQARPASAIREPEESEESSRGLAAQGMAGQARAKQAGGEQARATQAGGEQGFVTGSLLRVTPSEFHREMRRLRRCMPRLRRCMPRLRRCMPRYMPSANGKLVSAFQWELTLLQDLLPLLLQQDELEST